MEDYLEILSHCPLFAGITRQELTAMLDCLDGRITEAAKGSPVFLEGVPASHV